MRGARLAATTLSSLSSAAAPSRRHVARTIPRRFPLAPQVTPSAPSPRYFWGGPRSTPAEASEPTSEAPKVSETTTGVVNEDGKLPETAEATEPQEDSAKIAELQKAIAVQEAEATRLKDHAVRVSSEAQDTQAILAREKSEARDFAIRSLARDFLRDVDVMDLALRYVPDAQKTAEGGGSKELVDLYGAVSQTRKQLEKTFGRYGIEAFKPVGEVYNPDEQEATGYVPIPGKEPNTVLDCSKVGYRIKGKLLRAAEVLVVQPQ